MVRFVHAADLHLDTPFTGLSNLNPDLAARLRQSTFESFDRIVDLCIAREADFLVIAADIFDSENKSLAAQVRFVSGLRRLSGAGIPVCFTCGNHDPADSWITSLDMPENVLCFGTGEVESRMIEKEGRPAARISGISYAERAVTANLARRFPPADDPSVVSVAVLHGTVGRPGPHANYAPFSLEDIDGLRYDYWALGHIHRHRIVRSAGPAVVYPGNPQGRHFGETGPRGCCLVEAEAGRPPRIEFIPTHSIRFERIPLCLDSGEGPDALEEKIEEALRETDTDRKEESCILRITLTGRTSFHSRFRNPEELGHLVHELNAGRLCEETFRWVDSILVQTRPELDIEQLRNQNDFCAGVLKRFEEHEANPEKRDYLVRSAEKGLSGGVLRERGAPDPAEDQAVLDQARWLLLDELTKEKK